MVREYTALELPDTLYHRRGHRSWVHPKDDPYLWDATSEQQKQPCPMCPKDAGQSVADSGGSSSAGEKQRKPLTSTNAKTPTPSDQALWDKSSAEGRKEYERVRKAKKRAAYSA